MNSPSRLPSAGPASSYSQNRPWTVNGAPVRQRPVARKPALSRRYEVSWLSDDGMVDDFVRVAPAIPIFEQAFSAFTHGALISTEHGQVAVEDLMPGTLIETASGEHAILRWIGAITLVPGAPTADDEPQRLYRVTADAFGLGRPATDVTFGPSARLLNRSPDIRNAMGSEAALAPVSTFEDGMGVVAITPVAPIRVYHLAFSRHQVVRANGIEVESYHPGPDATLSMSSELQDLFLSLFPHVDSMGGFGRMLWPRFEAREEYDPYEIA